jgi:hypothetical protein
VNDLDALMLRVVTEYNSKTDLQHFLRKLLDDSVQKTAKMAKLQTENKVCV